MDFTEVLALIGGVISLIVLVGAAAALVRGSFNKARMEGLSTANEELRARVSDLEGSNKALVVKEAAVEERCTHLERENQTLMELVTQRAEVGEVKTMLESHHSEAMTAWKYIGTLLEQMINEKENL